VLWWNFAWSCGRTRARAAVGLAFSQCTVTVVVLTVVISSGVVVVNVDVAVVVSTDKLAIVSIVSAKVVISCEFDDDASLVNVSTPVNVTYDFIVANESL